MSDNSGLLATAGWNGLFAIFVTLGCIAVAWALLQELKLDAFLRQPKGLRARFLLLLLSVVLGHAAARFIIDYWQWAGVVHWLFGTGGG